MAIGRTRPDIRCRWRSSSRCGGSSSRAGLCPARQDRYRRGGRGAVRRLSCVQLDSISAVERSHRIALTSRRRLPEGTVPRSSATGAFEYWAHEACLLPAEDWPLFRPAMARGGRRWYGESRSTPTLASTCSTRSTTADRSARGTSTAPRGGRDVELEAGEADARALWNHGDSSSPAARASSASTTSPSASSRRRCSTPRAARAGEPARVRAPRCARPRRADRERDRRALAAARRRRARPAAVDALVADGRSNAWRSRTAAHPCWCRRAPTSTCRPRPAPCCSPRSTTCSGTARSRAGS